MTPATWISLAALFFTMLVAAAGAIIWLVRLEGENKTTRALFEQHKQFVAERHDGIESKIDTLSRDVRSGIDAIWNQVHLKADKAGK